MAQSKGVPAAIIGTSNSRISSNVKGCVNLGVNGRDMSLKEADCASGGS